ncbi:Ig-like domain-containing protein [Nocardioides cynanchi]|uniref:Ig-like domain-containing protein n=1 Tax=Nocardioides cynanchi TaxID=2558918 RepID=UPI001243EE0A|nr:Ig-like domain-containing protein [Nocardioides cynanchi]
MVVSRVVAILGGAAVAFGLALPALPAYAAGPTDVYVEMPANGGDDAHDCSLANPCATVGAGIAAVASEGTVHIGAGTFDGELRPGAAHKSVTLAGAGSSGGASGTLLTADSSADGFVLEVGEETTTLTGLRIRGGSFIDALVDGTGALVANHVVLDHAGCNLVVEPGATASLTDSTVQEGGSPGCSTPTPSAVIAISGGSVALVRTHLLDAAVNVSGVEMTGGTFTADQSTFDDSAHDVVQNDSSGLKVIGGTATVTRSSFHGWGFQGVRVAGGAAVLADDTFQGNLVGVNVETGTATVVRSTFQDELASVQGTVSVVGSVLGSLIGGPPLTGIQECNGTITDLGYNLATDASCGFSGTSRQNVTGLDLDSGLADRGGPVPTVALLNPSVAVDAIPGGATYGASATPLCPASGSTDLRGVPRPAGGACDAGSYEMAGTTTTLTAPTTAKPHADVDLGSTVVEPQVIAGLESPSGHVTFSSGGQTLCTAPVQPDGTAGCTTSGLAAGSHPVTAAFTPATGSTLHASLSATRTIRVGTKPAFTSAGHTTFVVGTSRTFTVHASGAPGVRITLVKGRLPAGLTFHAGKGTATVSGKAKRSGTGRHRVTLRATNLLGNARQVLTIVVTR